MFEKIEQKVKNILKDGVSVQDDNKERFNELLSDLQDRKVKYYKDTGLGKYFTTDYTRLSYDDLMDIAKLAYGDEKQNKLQKIKESYLKAVNGIDKQRENARDQYEKTEKNVGDALEKKIISTGEKSAKHNTLRSSARELMDKAATEEAAEKIENGAQKLSETEKNLNESETKSKAEYENGVSEAEKYYDGKIQDKYDEISEYKKKDNAYTRSFIDGKKTNDYLVEQANALADFLIPIDKSERAEYLNSEELSKFFTADELKYIKQMFL